VSVSAKSGWDPADRFRDPLAAQVAWTPVLEAAASFPMQILQREGGGSLVYAPSRGMKVFALFFGVGPLSGVLFALCQGFEFIGSPLGIVVSLLGFAMGFSGWKIGRQMLAGARCRFDAGTRQFLATPVFGTHGSEPHLATRFTDVHALQVVPVSTDSLKGFELNLVLHDAQRVHVAIAPTLRDLEADAGAIAFLLGVPVWVHSQD
jgi:xanthosine utilization system XapX-like protein